MAHPDTRVLSYHDLLLRNADLNLLRGPEWLNDQLIAFYFTYLLEDLHPGLASRVCLMPPGSSFLLLNSDPSDASMIFDALQLHEKEMVIFAVNDNPDVDNAAGGSHWSCLCYHRPSNSFRHYDSSPANGNRAVARQLAGAAAPLVRSRSSTVQQPSFEQVSAMPSQRNGYDCGLYVCAAAEALCNLAAGPQHQQQQDGGSLGSSCWEESERGALQHISRGYIADLREQMLWQIEQLAEQEQRVKRLNMLESRAQWNMASTCQVPSSLSRAGLLAAVRQSSEDLG